MSSLTQEGIPELWDRVQDYQSKVTQAGELELKRRQQQTVWMWNHIKDNILTLFKHHPGIRESITKYEGLVARGAVAPGYAADALLQMFIQSFQTAKSGPDDKTSEKR